MLKFSSYQKYSVNFSLLLNFCTCPVLLNYRQVLVKFCPPRLLNAVSRPQRLLRHGRALEHHRVVHRRLIRVKNLDNKKAMDEGEENSTIV